MLRIHNWQAEQCIQGQKHCQVAIESRHRADLENDPSACEEAYRVCQASLDASDWIKDFLLSRVISRVIVSCRASGTFLALDKWNILLLATWIA